MGSEHGHTPGPWHAPHFTRDEIDCNCGYIFAEDSRMGSIATVNFDNGKSIEEGGMTVIGEGVVQATVSPAAGDGAVNDPACQWQDISTARKDGSYVLLFGHHTRRGQPIVQIVARWDGRMWESSDDGYGAYIYPTHWMPLPPPPGDRTSASASASDSLNQSKALSTYTGVVYSAEFCRVGDSEDRRPGTYITIRLDDDKAGIPPGRVQVTYLPTQGEDL